MDIKEVNRDKHIRSNRFDTNLKHQAKQTIQQKQEQQQEGIQQNILRKEIQDLQNKWRRDFSGNKNNKNFLGNSEKGNNWGNDRAINKVLKRFQKRKMSFDI